MGWWSTPSLCRFTPRNDPVPIVQEAGWASGPVWTSVENLASTGIRSPERLARSESLYRLSYPGPNFGGAHRNNIFLVYLEEIRVFIREPESEVPCVYKSVYEYF